MTITCKKCKGTGKIKEDECEVCHGSGVVIDSMIPDTIKEFAKELGNGSLARCTEKIYQHYGDKLVDAYNRGIEDGKNATVEAVKDQVKKNKELKGAKK